MKKTMTTTLIERYAAHLRERERSAATVEKYIRDLNALRLWLGGATLTKEALLEWRGRLALVLQTLCATGIRVSELKFITAEAVAAGRAEVANKGKRRVVFLPEKLRRLLKNYLRAQKRPPGRCSPPGRESRWTGAISGGT